MSQLILIIGRKENVKGKNSARKQIYIQSLDRDKDVTTWRGFFSSDFSIVQCTLCFSVKFCAAWWKLLRAHFLQQTSDERFRTRRACRSVSSLGLSCAVRLSKGTWGPCRPFPGAAAKGWRSNSLAFHLRGFMCVSALLQDTWTQRPVHTDRYRHRCTHTVQPTLPAISVWTKDILYIIFLSKGDNIPCNSLVSPCQMCQPDISITLWGTNILSRM